MKPGEEPLFGHPCFIVMKLKILNNFIVTKLKFETMLRANYGETRTALTLNDVAVRIYHAETTKVISCGHLSHFFFFFKKHRTDRVNFLKCLENLSLFKKKVHCY